MIRILTSDLTRNFTLGFAGGALALAVSNGADWLGTAAQTVAALL